MADAGATFELVLPESPAVRAWHGVAVAAMVVDTPDLPPDQPEETAAALADDRPAVRRESWLLRDRSVAVGVLGIRLPQLDNTDTANVFVCVHPDHRRRGHGRRLLEHAVSLARTAGRARLVAEVHEPWKRGEPAPGVAFATAAGATRALDEVRSTLDLTGLTDERLAELETEARALAGGYSLRQWEGSTPDDLAADQAMLKTSISADAPSGELDWEPEAWDVARLRDVEAVIEAQRRRRIVTAAQHDSSRRLVAYTDIGVSRLTPESAYQWDTVVVRDHRGHRLGMLVKAANLRRLKVAAPEVTRLITWNAESNSHMIAINDVLGFRPVGRTAEWQLPL